MQTSQQQTTLSGKDDKSNSNNIVRDMQELHSSLFNNARNSANLVIAITYAVTLCTWILTKGSMSPLLSGSVGILLIISVVSLMTFEVYKVLSDVKSQVSFIKNVKLTSNNVINAFDTMKNDDLATQQSMLRIWYLCFSVSVLTGFSAAMIMLYNYVDMVVINV